jgi:hypothetical protein
MERAADEDEVASLRERLATLTVDEEDPIDFDDFTDVKRQYDIYTAHFKSCCVPLDRMPPHFVRTFKRLEEKMTQTKKIALEFATQFASDGGCVTPVKEHAVQDIALFVAASRNYLESNRGSDTEKHKEAMEKLKQWQ